MNKYKYALIGLIATLLSFSCNKQENKEAMSYVENIRLLANEGQYHEALNKIDSIQTLFPKAFDQIKEGLALRQEVRKSFNQKIIEDCDSFILVNDSKIDSIKQFFVLTKNEKYQEKGSYIPKSVNTNTLGSNMLRAGVNEDGTMYVESIYIGSQLHNSVKVSTKDKESAESLPVMDDGLNFRFSNLGKQYEVIKVMPVHDNGLSEFIYNHSEQPLTVTLQGKQILSYPLSNVQKKAITDSYELSELLLQQDSLNMAKGKAETLIKYLDSKISNEEEN